MKDKTGLRDLVKILHPLERKIVPLLKSTSLFSELANKSSLKDVEVMRALQWLQNKGVLKLKEDVREVVVLGENGREALKTGLPEKAFLEAIRDAPKSINKIMKTTQLSPQEINACLGLLKKKAAININKERVVSLSQNGKQLLARSSLEEQLLKKLSEQEVEKAGLKDEEKLAFENLKKRKQMIKTETRKDWHILLTSTGKKLVTANMTSEKMIEKVTSSMLKTGSWKNKEFRAYDVRADVPRTQRGKRHFVKQAVNHIRKIWLEMGFQEMKGPVVQTSFWNFDALFTAQDHPVRDLQDTFFIREPAKGELQDKQLVKKVRAVHETGKGAQSKGWGYEWDEEEAKKNVLRTHTTCLSAKTIAGLNKKDLPAKFFSIGKNFRNETVDWSHLFELVQVEGIVLDKNADFRHLLGYLKEFYKKLGFKKVRARPGYFPYTEPSVEVEAYHPVHKKWVELGGAGIFRPEVVIPLFGEWIPVLAWGQGMERSIMDYFDIHDIRRLYKNDLKQLREIKEWMR